MKITKEQKKYVSVAVAAFKVTDNPGEFMINWLELQYKNLPMSSRLSGLLSDIKDMKFAEQYYYSKKFAEDNNLKFTEISFKNWRNKKYD